jgi:hypothetical protein
MTPAALFTVPLKQVLSSLALSGLTAVHDPNLVLHLSANAAASATNQLRKKGKPIFQCALREGGVVVRDSTNRARTTGDDKRVQCGVPRKAHPDLRAAVESVEQIISKVLASGGPEHMGMFAGRPVLIGNKTSSSSGPAGVQGPHTDAGFGQRLPFIVIAALQPGTRLRVAMNSHATIGSFHAFVKQQTVDRLAALAAAAGPSTGPGQAGRGRGAANAAAAGPSTGRGQTRCGGGTSEALQDEAAAAGPSPGRGLAGRGGGAGMALQDEDDDEMKGEDEAGAGSETDNDEEDQLCIEGESKQAHMDAYTQRGIFAEALPYHPVIRLVLNPGDILFLHGNTVHAGDEGVAGEMQPRLHWEVRKDKLINATHLIELMHPKFAARFLEPESE